MAEPLFPVLGFGSLSAFCWFQVKLQEVCDIEYEVAEQKLLPKMNAQHDLFARCMSIVIRNQLLVTTFTCERDPRLFYFPEDLQDEIGQGKLSVGDRKSVV